jgi:predicted phosphate transport protein (TIGR00153 family)
LSEKALLSWFSRRKESVVASKTLDHAMKIADTVVELDKAIGAAMAEDRTAAMDALHRLMMRENEADTIERELFNELSRGELEPKDREDLMRLVRNVDLVADWAKVAGRNLQILIETEIHISKDVWARFKEITMSTVDCARLLVKTVEAFGVNADHVIDKAAEVNRLERVIDDLYYRIKKALVKSTADPRVVILLNDLLAGIENASDFCKDAADTLAVLVLAGR